MWCPKNYAHNYMFCCGLERVIFTHILQGCFTGTGAVFAPVPVKLPSKFIYDQGNKKFWKQDSKKYWVLWALTTKVCAYRGIHSALVNHQATDIKLLISVAALPFCWLPMIIKPHLISIPVWYGALFDMEPCLIWRRRRTGRLPFTTGILHRNTKLNPPSPSGVWPPSLRKR